MLGVGVIDCCLFGGVWPIERKFIDVFFPKYALDGTWADYDFRSFFLNRHDHGFGPTDRAFLPIKGVIMGFPYDLVILDRDGVINRDNPASVRSVADFTLLPGVVDAIAHLNALAVPVVVATNQAVVGRGDLSLAGLHRIHDHMAHLLAQGGARVDHIIYCTDTSVTPNNRRKPAPGMLVEAMAHYHTPPHKTIMIGDALRDYEAARAAGCDFLLVRTGHGARTETGFNLSPVKPLPPSIVAITDDLWAAIGWLDALTA